MGDRAPAAGGLPRPMARRLAGIPEEAIRRRPDPPRSHLPSLPAHGDRRRRRPRSRPQEILRRYSARRWNNPFRQPPDAVPFASKGRRVEDRRFLGPVAAGRDMTQPLSPTFTSVNPATGEELAGSIRESTAADVDKAVKAGVDA